MKKLLITLHKNTLSQITLLLVLASIAGLLSNWYDWIYPVFVVCSIILTFYVLVFTIAGFVNLIKDSLK
jgi:peroxiredoxin family protein